MQLEMDKEARDEYLWARKKFVLSYGGSQLEQERADSVLQNLIDMYGPVVRAYPAWHPLVRQTDLGTPCLQPSAKSGYEGLDHTVLFANAFVSCPYGTGETLLRSVDMLPPHRYARVTATRLEEPFYNRMATPIIVSCEWDDAPIYPDWHVPKAVAVKSMMLEEMRFMDSSSFGENVEDVRKFLLGAPCGHICGSLFVSQDTALAMLKVYKAMVSSEMFGPMRPRR
jgi:hypothetical protein